MSVFGGKDGQYPLMDSSPYFETATDKSKNMIKRK